MMAVKIVLRIVKVARVDENRSKCGARCQFLDGKFCRLEGFAQPLVPAKDGGFERGLECLEGEEL